MSKDKVAVIDSQDFFLEAQDIKLPTIAMSNGVTYSEDFVNTVHKGGIFFIKCTNYDENNFLTCNLLAKSPLENKYIVVASTTFEVIEDTLLWGVYPLVFQFDYINYHQSTGIFTRNMRIELASNNNNIEISVGISKIV